jgi:hypothetical protein
MKSPPCWNFANIIDHMFATCQVYPKIILPACFHPTTPTVGFLARNDIR